MSKQKSKQPNEDLSIKDIINQERIDKNSYEGLHLTKLKKENQAINTYKNQSPPKNQISSHRIQPNQNQQKTTIQQNQSSYRDSNSLLISQDQSQNQSSIQQNSFLHHNQKLFQEAVEKLNKIELKNLVKEHSQELLQRIEDEQLFKNLKLSVLSCEKEQKKLSDNQIIQQSKSQIQLGQRSEHQEELIRQITAVQNSQLVTLSVHKDSSKISSNSNRSLNKSTISSHNTSKQVKTQQSQNSSFLQSFLKKHDPIQVQEKSKALIQKTERLLDNYKIQSGNSGSGITKKSNRKNRDLKVDLERSLSHSSEDEKLSKDLQNKLIKKYQKILQIDNLADSLFQEERRQNNQRKNKKSLSKSQSPQTKIKFVANTLEEHLKGMSPKKLGETLRALGKSDEIRVDVVMKRDSSLQSQKIVNENNQEDLKMAYQMSQRQLVQQKNIVQPGPFLERQTQPIGSSITSQSLIQQQQLKIKSSQSQTRGTQQPQQIQHKMSQKRLVEEIKQLNRKLETNPNLLGTSSSNHPQGLNQIQLNPINSSNPNITHQDINNLSLKLQNQLTIPSLGRNSQQGIYQNMQMRSAPGIYNNIQAKTQYKNGFQNLNASGYLGYNNNDKSLMMSSNGYQQINQNTTLNYFNNKNGLNSFLTPQRQAKLNEIQKGGKKLVIKANQIHKNQQSPQSQYLMNNAQIGMSNLNAKDKVMLDKKTYEDLMNYLVKVECNRIEKDRVQTTGNAHSTTGQQPLSGKRPSSTLKRLAGIAGGQTNTTMERLSHNPRPYGINLQNNKDVLLFNPQQNNFNNSSFLSAAPTSLGRNSKLSKTPQKKMVQPQKLKNFIHQNTQLNQSSAEDRGIAQSNSLRQIKRNNYVNELQSAYNHQTENLNKSSIAPGGYQNNNQTTTQVSSFFNINQSQSIPTSKKGTQKKIELQDSLPQEYQQMTQPKLQQLLQTGKFSQQKNAMLNPQALYMGDKVQSARGMFKGVGINAGKDILNISGISHTGMNAGTNSAFSKVSNLLMHKDKQIKIGGQQNQFQNNHQNIGQLDGKQLMSQRDNSVNSKQASSRQNQNNYQESAQQKLNKAQENNLVKRLTSGKNKKDNNQQEKVKPSHTQDEYILNAQDVDNEREGRREIKLDSELLYGSNLSKSDNVHVILKDEIPGNEIYVIDHIDHQNFDTFGDSEKNKKITAVSELHSPDNRMHSPHNQIQQINSRLQNNIRVEKDPYKNQNYHGKEFHYSGSFGVPMQLQNQAYYIDQNNKIVQSVINQGPNNLSFSIVGQNDMSIISQEQLQSNQHAYIDKKGAIIIEDNEVLQEAQVQKEGLQNGKIEDDQDEVLQIIDQPFYLQDYQEEYLDQEKIPDSIRSTLSPQSRTTQRNEILGIDNQTVEAVKKKLINDPEYRRELLERVLPQFSKLNEQFSNSFLYRLKYSNEDSSQNSNSIQKSNQSTQRLSNKQPLQKQLQPTHSQQSLNSQTNQPQEHFVINYADNLIVQSSSDNDFDILEGDDGSTDLYTFDQRRGTDPTKYKQLPTSIMNPKNAQNEDQFLQQQPAYELLRKINQNFNRANLNTIQSSSRRNDNGVSDQASLRVEGAIPGKSIQKNIGEIMLDMEGNLILVDQNLNSNRSIDDVNFQDDDDDDETNTVIENECENEYTDIYQSIGEDEQETEELRRKREFEYQKMLLKKEIMMVAGGNGGSANKKNENI